MLPDILDEGGEYSLRRSASGSVQRIDNQDLSPAAR